MFILILFFSSLFIYLLYNFLFLSRMGEPRQQAGAFRNGVSIIICAKNELENLKANLESWTSQNLENVEVVVVDDGSGDGTTEFLESAEQQGLIKLATTFAKATAVKDWQIGKLANDEEMYRSANDLSNRQQISRSTHQQIDPGKREALLLGARQAKHDILLLTDADCSPASNQWAERMTAPFQNQEIDLVLGYGPYRADGSGLNAFIRLETLATASLYLGAARMGLAYMGVGRNLAVRKDKLIQVLESANWKSKGGDDDEIVQRIATKKNVETVSHPDSFSWSEAKKTLSSYLIQKRRHIEASEFYSLKAKVIAGLFPISKIALDISLLIVLLMGYGFGYGFIWLSASIIRWFILYRNNIHLQSGLAVHEIVLIDFTWGLYYLVSPVWLYIFKSDTWK